MRSSSNARRVSPPLSAGLIALVLLCGWKDVLAQGRGGGSDARSDSVRMPNVNIEGERQTPDIFFVFPTGKGGNLSAPRLRDYRSDILTPVVKPWLERDTM